LLGADARPLADNDQNEIVIGYAGRGHGSNTATIGNSSVTALYLGSNRVYPKRQMYFVGKRIGSSFNPADSTYYYAGNTDTSGAGTFTDRLWFAPADGVITFASLNFTCNPGSSENAKFELAVSNGSTWSYTTIATKPFVQYTNVVNSSLSVSVSAGYMFMIRVTPPAWATNPTTVVHWQAVIRLETD
jgi:hypothetical protein